MNELNVFKKILKTCLKHPLLLSIAFSALAGIACAAAFMRAIYYPDIPEAGDWLFIPVFIPVFGIIFGGFFLYPPRPHNHRSRLSDSKLPLWKSTSEGACI